MEFVKNFTLPDFQGKTFTPAISPNFNSFSDNNTKNGEIYTTGKKFTLPPAVTGGTNLTFEFDESGICSKMPRVNNIIKSKKIDLTGKNFFIQW